MRDLVELGTSNVSGILVWACGCETWREGEIFYIRPCGKPGCKVAPITIEEAKRRGNALSIRYEED